MVGPGMNGSMGMVMVGRFVPPLVLSLGAPCEAPAKMTARMSLHRMTTLSAIKISPIHITARA
jgi:hypothetical protein